MREYINELGSKNIPFIFIIDYAMQRPVVIPLDRVDSNQLLYDFEGITNCKNKHKNDDFSTGNDHILLKSYPVDFREYKKAFDKLYRHFISGNTFLTNLTFATKIELNISLKEVFYRTNARFRLYFNKDGSEFVVFSPEIFIKIKNQKIYSYPMKGTIDASIPDASNIIINDEKEFAEHITIVDLIRNDLSIVAEDVCVNRFRYVDYIKTQNRNLLQVSSEIQGSLREGYNRKIGDLIYDLLPAGSICGAPKKKTLEIINQIETYRRGYYTGVCGIYNNGELISGVMIRFIENKNGQLYYKSGGGITVYSDAMKEYNELKEKIYVPVLS